ncbi:radical SAM family heme chaperone HemW [Primorskyibacter sp. S87]|uniref:radical SAM family heme chaperone HemW n=1 Tax=Primorskyibacter sp. S87 TaxID=3415126 RepID=UPI003C7E07B9
MAEDWRNGGFGLYIHWPFCEAKCPYCDFNSHVSRQIDQKQWVDAYLAELSRAAAETPGRVLDSIFFGGGTPSLMDPETVDAIITSARANWSCANSIEITLEANPGSVEAGRFADYRQAGVNRISMGIQALHDDDLRRLGRIHTVNEGLAAFETARNLFDRVSFDLIYARQHQSLADWRSELNSALTLGLDHISLYQLTIEAGTAFGDRYAAGKLRGLPEEELSADMYQVTQEICTKAGLPAYEVSNHALPGSESKHNLIYWRYGDYVGIGPGAHGRMSLTNGRFATESFRTPQEWLSKVASGSGESLRSKLPASEQAQEFLLMGLRLVEGVDLDRFENLAGHSLDDDVLNHLKSLDLLQQSDRRIATTNKGRMVLNGILRELLIE